MNGSIILSTAYLPPVEYVAAMLNAKEVLIEVHETYCKQTYRNRCLILSANGPLALVIPVIRPKGNRTPVSEVVIDYSTRWNRNHWRAIESAYRTSAYYEFIGDVLLPFYQSRHERLVDFNSDLLKALLGFLEVDIKVRKTEEFRKQVPQGILDLRSAFSPKAKPESHVTSIEPYFQVFSHKFGFTPNLSIIDLLFNEGTFSKQVLMRANSSI